MLSEHLNGEYLTLCPQCHHNVHERNKKRRASLSDEQKQRLKQLRLEKKQQKLDALKQQRVELIDQVLGVELNSEQFKNLTEKLNFRRDGRMLKNPIDEIKQLGYEVINKRTKNKRYKIITKTTLDKSKVS